MSRQVLSHQPCISSLLLYHQNFEDIEESADQPKNEKVSLSLDPISEPGTNLQNSDDALTLDIWVGVFDSLTYVPLRTGIHKDHCDKLSYILKAEKLTDSAFQFIIIGGESA